MSTTSETSQRYDLELAGFDPYANTGGAYFDIDKGLKVLEFFDKCITHVKGHLARMPIRLEDWQQRLLVNLFGWIKPNGYRRFKTLFLYVPRKNAKTTLCGGIVNYVLFCDGEGGAEMYSAAAKRDQASLCYQQVSGMIRNCRALNKRATIYKSMKSVELKNDEATVYKVISSDASSEHGGNSHLVIVDELHDRKDSELVDTLLTSTGSRKQPIVIFVTTADFDRPSACNEELAYARDVRDGIIDDPSYFPVIYESIRDKDDWHSEETWKKANPNWGASVDIESFREKYVKAKNKPSFENTFKRLYLNMQTEQAERWLAMGDWKLCTDTFTDEELEGEICYGGLDISAREDITCFCLFFPSLLAVKPFFFVPEDNLGKFRKYKEWEKSGFIIKTDGITTDQRAVLNFIVDCNEYYRIVDIGFDPWECVHLAYILQEEYCIDMVTFPQNTGNYNAPAKDFETWINDHKLRHNHNPVLHWMAGNVAIKRNNMDQIMVTKKHSPSKIDGICAALMAIGRYLCNEKGAYSFETGGAHVL
jgi:phage terminase large subunit-like protein